MGLAWELHELIQDFVDGKLTPEREREVQAFLDRHPTAQQVADQYRMVTQPDLPVEKSVSRSAERLADRVMDAIPTGPWYQFVMKPWFWGGLSTLAASILLFFVIDLTVISQWLQSQLVAIFAGFGLVSQSLDQVNQRMEGVMPILVASVLIAAFWGTVDRLLKLTSRAKQA